MVESDGGRCGGRIESGIEWCSWVKRGWEGSGGRVKGGGEGKGRGRGREGEEGKGDERDAWLEQS